MTKDKVRKRNVIAVRPERKEFFSLKKEARERGLSMNQLVIEILKGRKVVMA